MYQKDDQVKIGLEAKTRVLFCRLNHDEHEHYCIRSNRRFIVLIQMDTSLDI